MPIGVYSHHMAKYNLRMIFENLLLIEDHMKLDPCANCLTKHCNLVMAYSHEGRSLDGASEVMGLFDEIDAFVPAVLETVLSCSSGGACEVKEPQKMAQLVQDVRRMRRVIGMAVFGIDSDIVHDIQQDEGTPHEQPQIPHEEPMAI